MSVQIGQTILKKDTHLLNEHMINYEYALKYMLIFTMCFMTFQPSLLVILVFSIIIASLLFFFYYIVTIFPYNQCGQKFIREEPLPQHISHPSLFSVQLSILKLGNLNNHNDCKLPYHILHVYEWTTIMSVFEQNPFCDNSVQVYYKLQLMKISFQYL